MKYELSFSLTAQETDAVRKNGLLKSTQPVSGRIWIKIWVQLILEISSQLPELFPEHHSNVLLILLESRIGLGALNTPVVKCYYQG